MNKVLEKEKCWIAGNDFRKVISEAKTIYAQKVKNKSPLIAKKFSLHHVLVKHEVTPELKNNAKYNPAFIANNQYINISFEATTKTGMEVIHAIEIASIKCGMAFTFRRYPDSIKISLNYR